MEEKKTVGRPPSQKKQTSTGTTKTSQKKESSVDLTALLEKLSAMENEISELKNNKSANIDVDNDTVTVRCNVLQNIKLKRHKGDTAGKLVPMLGTKKIKASILEDILDEQSYRQLFSMGILTLEKDSDYNRFDIDKNESLVAKTFIDMFKKKPDEVISEIRRITKNRDKSMWIVNYHVLYLIAYYKREGLLEADYETMEKVGKFFKVSPSIIAAGIDVRLKEKM